VRRPFWTRRKICCLRQRYCLTSSSVCTSALSPYRNIQVTMTISGRSRHLHSNAKECEDRMLEWRRLELSSWSLAMSCMLKGREMKRLRAAVTASATACIMSRTPSIVLCVKWRWAHAQGRMVVTRDDAPDAQTTHPV
jgi:hypothetical protein